MALTTSKKMQKKLLVVKGAQHNIAVNSFDAKKSGCSRVLIVAELVVSRTQCTLESFPIILVIAMFFLYFIFS